MARSFTGIKRIRKSFGKLPEKVEIPNLIEVQRDSYRQFLQDNIVAENRQDRGLQAVFQSVFPISDYAGQAQLEFIKYEFEDPKYDTEECSQRGLTYAAPLKIVLRLVVWDVDEDTDARSIRDIKEQEVYLGDIPLMTENGTFIINGTERVIVSQMHRSPGIFFSHDDGKTHQSGKLLFSARLISGRGSWLEFEFDGKDVLHVRIDRRRKLPVTTFLRCLAEDLSPEAMKELAFEDYDKIGMVNQDIIDFFYGKIPYVKKGKNFKTKFVVERFRGTKMLSDLVDAKTGKTVVEAGQKLTARKAKLLKEEGLEELLVQPNILLGSYLAKDLVDPSTGEVIAEIANEITEEILEAVENSKIKEVDVLDIDHVTVGPYIVNSMLADKSSTRSEALIDIYRIMRPGEPPTLEGAESLFRGLFFDQERYDLTDVGRVKLNARLDLDCPDDYRVLRKVDILEIVKYLVRLKDGQGEVDDIDHLGNRRVRSVGELMENQTRIGLMRMERSIRERIQAVDVDTMMPSDVVNGKPFAAGLKEFFGSSQLSQFMDQTNPLSEITHKRRLSALGPGGLTRERAGFEVRDVHPTHYGRICPIETPEGPNIGLINSLATYARVNQYGFIETPYRKVVDGQVQEEVIYMSAMEEGKYTIAQANANLDKKNKFADEFVSCRKGEDYHMLRPEDIDLIDVSPKQLVSVATSLIPFLENDDANRALMGSNMQRQAVPLMKSEAPLVGTGMEETVAQDSGATILAKHGGVVDQVDGRRIVISREDPKTGRQTGVDIYSLQKYQRSNQNTCVNQRPLVRVGDRVNGGDIIADGPSTDIGELALGRNVLCAFMPWNGYNFEDSILISERLVKDDVFTSIHIDEFEVVARDTKLGQEEITRDIPNVGEESLKYLDEAGIVYVGAEVKPGDILVGKVTPKGESPMTPEEKLLRAIFGEKASDVRDTSLRLPPGVAGTIVDVRVFSRRGIEKDERAQTIERAEYERLAVDRDAEQTILQRSFNDRVFKRYIDQKVVKGEGLKKGTVLTEDILKDIPAKSIMKIVIEDADLMAEIESMYKEHVDAIEALQKRFESKVQKLQAGDELLPGIMKMVKVFVAVKRKLQPGDKMAGRHGNKGVISNIMPAEDMPYLEDGTPVDIVLNPLGVPSRMNVGQILETHMGWASHGLGRQIRDALEKVQVMKTEKEKVSSMRDALKHAYDDAIYDEDIKGLDGKQVMELAENVVRGVPIATPVFDGAHEADIVEMLDKAGLDSSGQVTLYDGRTGIPFDRQVTVGYIYMLKLHHLVDEKIHSRSIGPYSLVTQQPLGGKAQFGGQRFGEMEVWALEAYGAAYTLQEMLTVKSDDVAGRTKVYETIIRGEDNFEAGIPESFNVLVKELRSLCLNIDMKSRA